VHHQESATLTEVFPHVCFLSCKANTRAEHAMTGHGPHSSQVRLLNFNAIYS